MEGTDRRNRPPRDRRWPAEVAGLARGDEQVLASWGKGRGLSTQQRASLPQRMAQCVPSRAQGGMGMGGSPARVAGLGEQGHSR